MRSKTFPNLKKLAQHIRDVLGDKKCYLVFAHNSTGKTRLSCAFKDLGKKKEILNGFLETYKFNTELFGEE